MDSLKSSFITREELPLVIEPKKEKMGREEFTKLLRKENAYFRAQILKCGGILFRNFSIENEDDFAAVIDGLNLGKSLNYIGGDSPRSKIKGGIYTSTEAPPSVKIPLHNELSFVKNYPKHIYFYCHVAPQDRGETIIGDARKIAQAVDPEVKKRFVDRRLRYVSCYYFRSKLMEALNKWQRSHKPWRDVFETEDKSEVERLCRENEFEFEWNQNNWLKIAQERPALMNHPITQEEVWFNQVHLYDFNPKLLGVWRYIGAKLFYCRPHMKLHEVFFADRERIPRSDIYHVMDVLDANTLSFPWRKGDVLVLDNILSMHGRATFTGPRRILTAMTG